MFLIFFFLKTGLTSLPNTLDPKYQTIVMDGNPLERLEKDVFKAAGLVNLQVIQMRNCHLIDVHEHAFRGLVILKEVDIRYVDMLYFQKEKKNIKRFVIMLDLVSKELAAILHVYAGGLIFMK